MKGYLFLIYRKTKNVQRRLIIFIAFLCFIIAIGLIFSHKAGDKFGFLKSVSTGTVNQQTSDGENIGTDIGQRSASSVYSRITPTKSGNLLTPFSQEKNLLRNDPDKWFEEAKMLAVEGQSEEVYLNEIRSLLDQYVIITKEGGYPTGLNLEITNALLGKNSKKIALISASHPRIKNGELTDSWGTPYFFHNDSLNEISIRSAGADLTLYTDDDIYSDHKSSMDDQ